MANTKITTNVIADDAVTSDKLGGDLTMPGHVSLADNKELRIGTGNDLVIKHTGSHANITNTTGNLTLRGDTVYIANGADSEYMAQFVANGAASLRYDDTEQLATITNGVYVPNKLGVGTNSLTRELTVKLNGQADVSIVAATNQYAQLLFGDTDADNKGIVAYNNTTDILEFWTSGSSRMAITSAGNVSIGNSSVAFPSGEGLQVYSSGNPRIKLANSTTGVASGDGTQFYLDGADVIYDNKDAGNQRWYTGGAERMRMDSSGNVGIGVTPSGAKLHVVSAGSGVKARFSDNTSETLDIGITTDSHAYLNQANSGPIAFQIGGTEIARVTTAGIAMTDGKGIDFSATGSGTSTSGQAHVLDEYEYGSWTPTCHTGSATFVSPYYVKIGRVVHFSFQVHQFTDTSTASSIDIRGLPFPCLVGQAAGTVFGIYLDTEVDSVYVNTAEEIFFYELTNSGWYAARHSDINSSSAYFYVGGTYITSS